eukprot:CAMPEP_0172488976 /NCGR_PEP_ID=MMETSP1066-20121228/18714_1 /TAXON_ID=671091 /ORGANISM="Coscinodiscus wailesii, Strain CCMP2513" /LENGTH=273 /DNA_ID=CAMNT_0013256525 /DNA_START=64 /DNA_END=885 /DNA_ORIENTATION=+
MNRWQTKKKAPQGYEIISTVLAALENELRDKVKESNVGLRNTESMWPILQIQHQRTRYVYDMYYTYKRIPRKVYDYCIKNKIIDAALIAKWKKPGYERLCATYVINPTNYKFGTTSICRVPLGDRSEEQRKAQDPTTGCFGCASGRGAAPKNIFGNKYGQNLAAVQIARERKMEAVKARMEREERMRKEKELAAAQDRGDGEEEEGGSETEDSDSEDDEDDYGPEPEAGVWAGSQKLERESERIADDDDDDEEEDEESRPAKKQKASCFILEE